MPDQPMIGVGQKVLSIFLRGGPQLLGTWLVIPVLYPNYSSSLNACSFSFLLFIDSVTKYISCPFLKISPSIILGTSAGTPVALSVAARAHPP